jgi:hypothetical protein
VVQETGALSPELEKRYAVMKGQPGDFAHAVVALVNSFDKGKSRTSSPSFTESMKLVSNLMGELGKVTILFKDIGDFRTEVAKLNGKTIKRFAA